MEIVAMDMKLRGIYIARQLSFQVIQSHNRNTIGIRLPALRLPETSSYWTFSSPVTEWSNGP